MVHIPTSLQFAQESSVPIVSTPTTRTLLTGRPGQQSVQDHHRSDSRTPYRNAAGGRATRWPDRPAAPDRREFPQRHHRRDDHARLVTPVLGLDAPLVSVVSVVVGTDDVVVDAWTGPAGPRTRTVRPALGMNGTTHRHRQRRPTLLYWRSSLRTVTLRPEAVRWRGPPHDVRLPIRARGGRRGSVGIG